VDKARRLIAETDFDAALVDANLAGHPVHELAAALTRKDIPFAFATGYGRDGLPAGFQDAPILSKPFGERELHATLEALLVERASSPEVVRLRPKQG
jgi:DNA-binding response OmpR family regulator